MTPDQHSSGAGPKWVGAAGVGLALVGLVSGALMMDRTTQCGGPTGCQRPDLYLGAAVSAISVLLGMLVVLLLVVLDRLRVGYPA